MDKIDVILTVSSIVMFIILVLLGEKKRSFVQMQLFESYEEFLKAPKRKRGLLIYSLDYVFISLYMISGARRGNYFSILTGLFDITETSMAIHMRYHIPSKEMFTAFRAINILKYMAGACGLAYNVKCALQNTHAPTTVHQGRPFQVNRP